MIQIPTDDGVVRVLVLLVQDGIGRHHVVNNIGLGDFLAPKLLGGRQVHSVVVAQVVVRSDGQGLDAGIDKEVDEHRLELGLTALEVVAADEDTVTLGEIDQTGNKGVLRAAVDKGGSFEDRSHGKDCRRGNFRMALLERGEEVVGSVVDAFDNVREPLGVGGPEDNDLVQAVSLLERPIKSIKRRTSDSA